MVISEVKHDKPIDYNDDIARQKNVSFYLLDNNVVGKGKQKDKIIE